MQKYPPYYHGGLTLYVFQDGGLNTSGETDNDIPKFITDNNDKTNYVRGKFLGKVKSINLPGKRGVKNMSFGRGMTGPGLLVKVMLGCSSL